MQCVEDAALMAVMALQSLHWGARQGATVDVLFIRSISGAVGRGLLSSILRASPIAWLKARQWIRVLAPLRPRAAYRSRSWAHPVGDLLDIARAYGSWRRARQMEGDFRVEIHGIEVGDLVVDSYLRFNPSPRFNAEDRFVWALIWQAYRDVRRARAYFAARRPAIYLTTYTTYLEHGVAVRAALAAGVPVRAFGNLQVFGIPVTPKHPFHTTDTSRYARDFDALPDKDSALKDAERGLELRMSGGIDAATAYMRASAYAPGDESVPDVRGAVVVFLHDFYDSPHVYPDLVFQDFWAWIVCTIETLESNGTPFFLKPHPNQIALSEGVLAELRSAFPLARFLSPRLTNVQLVRAGMLCGVTVYGTVAHELAYLGVPSIACAGHPHRAFDFCRTARSVEQYRVFLESPALHPASADEMRRQAMAFYYMHNLHGSDELRALRGRFVAFWAASHDDATTPDRWWGALEQLAASPGFAMALPASRGFAA